jgi:hypothetical protein
MGTADATATGAVTADAAASGATAASIGSGGNAALANYGLLNAAPEAANVASAASTLAPYGPNGEYLGQTIEASGLTPNAYTGGYDALNGVQRFGQQFGDVLSQANSGGLNKVLMNGFQQGLKASLQPQQQAAARPANISVQHPGPAQTPLSSFVSMSPYEQQRQRWLASLGRVNT